MIKTVCRLHGSGREGWLWKRNAGSLLSPGQIKQRFGAVLAGPVPPAGFGALKVQSSENGNRNCKATLDLLAEPGSVAFLFVLGRTLRKIGCLRAQAGACWLGWGPRARCLGPKPRRAEADRDGEPCRTRSSCFRPPALPGSNSANWLGPRCAWVDKWSNCCEFQEVTATFISINKLNFGVILRLRKRSCGDLSLQCYKKKATKRFCAFWIFF